MTYVQSVRGGGPILRLVALFDGFAAALKKARDARGWTQAKLAEESGVNRATIIEIERQSRPADAATIEKISSALGWDIYDLADAIAEAVGSPRRHAPPVQVSDQAIAIASVILPGAPPEDLGAFVRATAESMRLEGIAAALRRKWPDEGTRVLRELGLRKELPDAVERAMLLALPGPDSELEAELQRAAGEAQPADEADSSALKETREALERKGSTLQTEGGAKR